ncbi:hypothetical protein ACFQV2_16005 [Actinokineospora soli]|uniref:Uncharacterized protein n=1 Tax=Actinokineospora soli TaxID=1048753 RepID=A0ABW2TNK8_9PSEU
MVVSLTGSPKKLRVSLDDWLMMVFAVVSVGLLVYRTFFDPPPTWPARSRSSTGGSARSSPSSSSGAGRRCGSRPGSCA